MSSVVPPPTAAAVVLLSGGMDSAVTLAIARQAGFACHAVSFAYGQRHAVELAAAERVAAAHGATDHRVIPIAAEVLAGSALTGTGAVPRDRAAIGRDIPPTYVPARNTVFLALALAVCEQLDAHDVYLGVNAVDYSGYPDCRPEFLAAFQATARLGTRLTDLTLRAPLLRLTKTGIVRRGIELGVDFGLTRSCYDPDTSGAACGHCDACLLRLRAFAELGIADPAPYREGVR
jgi:7-cyano-7-deazaguanine synthase